MSPRAVRWRPTAVDKFVGDIGQRSVPDHRRRVQHGRAIIKPEAVATATTSVGPLRISDVGSTWISPPAARSRSMTLVACGLGVERELGTMRPHAAASSPARNSRGRPNHR